MKMEPASKETEDSGCNVQFNVWHSLAKTTQTQTVYLHYCSSSELHPAQETPKLKMGKETD